MVREENLSKWLSIINKLQSENKKLNQKVQAGLNIQTSAQEINIPQPSPQPSLRKSKSFEYHMNTHAI